MSFKTGDTIGSYRLVAECGKGAYGSVFLAESTVTLRKCALKVVWHRGRNCDRELKGLASYQAICPRTDLLQIYHVEDCGEFFYYTMDAADDLNAGGEYVPDTLANRLRASGRLSAEAVRQMADELSFCLGTLHGRGVLHRDVKPDNILWIDGAAKLGDIGLVAADGSTVLAGTPGFLPPEVLAGVREYEARDDFYALGKAIYCALSGRPVEEYPSFPDSRTLGDCGDLILLYNRLCGGETDVPLFASKGRRRRCAWIAAAVVLTLVCGMTAWFALRPTSAPMPPTASKSLSAPMPDALRPTTVVPQRKYVAERVYVRTELPDYFGARYLGLEEFPEVTAAKNAPAADKRAERVREVGELLAAYAVSPEFAKLLPRIIGEERRMREKLVLKNPDSKALRAYMLAHRDDPEKQFESQAFRVRNLVNNALEMVVDTSGIRGCSMTDSLKEALIRRKKLESVLLAKYKTGDPEAAAP